MRTMSHEKYLEYQSCIVACMNCVVACNHCAACCLQEPDVKMLAACIGLDMDCAQVCQVAAALMSGGSDFAPQMCRLCADVCKACAAECGQHDMDHCQQCAEACRICAGECEKVAG
jgi:hypothetical protein